MTREEQIERLRAAAALLRPVAQEVGPMHSYWEAYIFPMEEEAKRLEKAP